MTFSTYNISPLRQRMIDDMRMRKLSPKTQSSYIRVVKRFAGFLGRSPDTASVEDLRRYQLHLPHKLPVVLSREEVARLLAAVDNLKHQTALAVAYGAGLRVSEVVSLKV